MYNLLTKILLPPSFCLKCSIEWSVSNPLSSVKTGYFITPKIIVYKSKNANSSSWLDDFHL